MRNVLEWNGLSLHRLMESIGAVAPSFPPPSDLLPSEGTGGRSRLWLSPSREPAGLPVEAKGQVRPQLMVCCQHQAKGPGLGAGRPFHFLVFYYLLTDAPPSSNCRSGHLPPATRRQRRQMKNVLCWWWDCVTCPSAQLFGAPCGFSRLHWAFLLIALTCKCPSIPLTRTRPCRLLGGAVRASLFPCSLS